MTEWKEPEQITDLKKDEQKKTDINQKIKNAFYLEKNNGKVTLQALAEPKLGNVEFYLKKPDEKAEYRCVCPRPDRKSTRLNSSHVNRSRMPSSA